jgi:hypothetical protein
VALAGILPSYKKQNHIYLFSMLRVESPLNFDEEMLDTTTTVPALHGPML